MASPQLQQQTDTHLDHLLVVLKHSNPTEVEETLLPSPMNGGRNAAMAMNTINLSAMNSMMPSLAYNGMAGMTMASMNAAGLKQSMGHPVMSSGGMPQV
jgi:hypothetical protein